MLNVMALCAQCRAVDVASQREVEGDLILADLGQRRYFLIVHVLCA